MDNVRFEAPEAISSCLGRMGEIRRGVCMMRSSDVDGDDGNATRGSGLGDDATDPEVSANGN
jgi:hypothetical protein